MRILAALASVPGRPLETVLRSLRPQVDQLAVCLNGYETVPPYVRELCTDYMVDPRNQLGAEAKLAWAEQWDGIYLSCDDDLEYPPDYARTMASWVTKWAGQALVTCHGKVYRGPVTRWSEFQENNRCLEGVAVGHWINHPGTGVLAFHTSLGVPAAWPERNCADLQLALWAQRAGVPTWVIPFAGGWLRYLLPSDAPTVYRSAAAEGFRTRDRLIRTHRTWHITEL